VTLLQALLVLLEEVLSVHEPDDVVAAELRWAGLGHRGGDYRGTGSK
jgi:hypothetical protein